MIGIDDVIRQDLSRIGRQYVEDGDLAWFEYEVSKLAFILTTHMVVLPEQLKEIDRQHNHRKKEMMKDVVQEIRDLLKLREQEDDQ